MKRIITLALCLTLILAFLTSCSNNYEFRYAFFPISVANDYEPADDIQGDDVSLEYEPILNKTMSSLTEFINNKFNLSISKSIPEVKSFTPNKESVVATYFKGTLFVNPTAISDYSEFFIVHELIHYLSDNNGHAGFTHITEHDGYQVFVGYGITEGFADIIAYMYCEENGIETPDLANFAYNNNERVAAVYYMLEPETIRWYFASDHERMSKFVKENVEKVALIPQEYNTEFDFHFYVCQDLLLDCSTGNINDYNTSLLSFKASFEMACITARASENKDLKRQIYNEILSECDDGNAIKKMILG